MKQSIKFTVNEVHQILWNYATSRDLRSLSAGRYTTSFEMNNGGATLSYEKIEETKAASGRINDMPVEDLRATLVRLGITNPDGTFTAKYMPPANLVISELEGG